MINLNGTILQIFQHHFQCLQNNYYVLLGWTLMMLKKNFLVLNYNKTLVIKNKIMKDIAQTNYSSALEIVKNLKK